MVQLSPLTDVRMRKTQEQWGREIRPPYFISMRPLLQFDVDLETIKYFKLKQELH